MPAVSIIIPCYNYGHFLGEALDSVLNQTFQDWEAIIVDDGSTDNSKEVAVAYENKDSRFRYIFQSNSGTSAAKNNGLKNASGRFIQFLDADDYLFPRKLAVQVESLNQTGAALSVCDYHKSGPDDLLTPIQENFHRIRLGENKKLDLLFNWERNLSIPIHCFLFDRAQIPAELFLFSPELKNHEDIHLWLRIFWRSPEICYTQEVLAVYRKTPGGLTKNIREMRAGYVKALSLFSAEVTLSEPEKEILQRKINLILFWLPSNSELVARLVRPLKKVFGKNILNDLFYLQKWAREINFRVP
ncbi:MAG: glycosyltransferase [Bacteroidetes bacterium]|nr:glycosyltransferase [Bacteroidota bacterium]